MAKKKHRSGVSGNPAKRAQNDALRMQLAEYDRQLHAHESWSTDSPAFFDAEAHEALTGRGWTASTPGEGDDCGWDPSATEPDYATETYYEVTVVYPREYGLVVDLAGPTDGPFSGARYSSLERLLADADAIEAFRYGDPIPHLPHAIEVAEGLPSPLSVRREERDSSE